MDMSSLLYTGFVLHIVFFLVLFYFFNRTFKMKYVLIIIGIVSLTMWFLLDSSGVDRYMYPLIFLMLVIASCFTAWIVLKRKGNQRDSFHDWEDGHVR